MCACVRVRGRGCVLAALLGSLVCVDLVVGVDVGVGVGVGVGWGWVWM